MSCCELKLMSDGYYHSEPNNKIIFIDHVEKVYKDLHRSGASGFFEGYDSQTLEVDEQVNGKLRERIPNNAGVTKVTVDQAENLLNKLGIGYTAIKINVLSFASSKGLVEYLGNKMLARIHQPEMGRKLQSLELGEETDREAFHTACLIIGSYAQSLLEESIANFQVVTAKKTRGLFFSKKHQVIISPSNRSEKVINVITEKHFAQGAQNHVFMGMRVREGGQGEVVVTKLHQTNPYRNNESLGHWEWLTQNISLSIENGKMPIQLHKLEWMNEISKGGSQAIYYYIERFSQEGTLKDFLRVLMDELFHRSPEERNALLNAFREAVCALLVNVGYMHQYDKTVHRDLKPANLIFFPISTEENPNSQALLMGDPEMCNTKYAISRGWSIKRAGTPAYIPKPFRPKGTEMTWEQCLYQDRYALGVILIKIANTLSKEAIDNYRSTQLREKQGGEPREYYNLSDGEQEKIGEFSELLVKEGNHLTGDRTSDTIDESRFMNENNSYLTLAWVAHYLREYSFD